MTAIEQRLARLVRADRRLRLRRALRGSIQDRWDYCVLRSMERSHLELAAFGRTTFDAHAAARQSVRNYQRLTRLSGQQAVAAQVTA